MHLDKTNHNPMNLLLRSQFIIIFIAYLFLFHNNIVHCSPTTKTAIDTQNLSPKDKTSRTLLESSDFHELNDFLQDVAVRFPDENIDLLPGTPLSTFTELQVNDFKCRQFAVENIESLIEDNEKEWSFPSSFEGISLSCTFEWVLGKDSQMFSRAGTGKVTVDNLSLKITPVFESDDGFVSRPPVKSSIENCDMDMNIKTLDIDGSLPAAALGNLVQLLHTVVPNIIHNAICGEVEKIGGVCLNESLKIVSDELKPYYEKSFVDPLFMENSRGNGYLDDDLVDFSGTDSAISQWYNFAADYMSSAFGEMRSDGTDLGINTLLRDAVLDSNRELRLVPLSGPLFLINFQDAYEMMREKLSECLISDDQVSFNANMYLSGVSIRGLDTFSTFDPLNVIGKQTIQHTFALENLDIVADLAIEMDSIDLRDKKNAISVSLPERVEHIEATFGLESIRSSISTYVELQLKSDDRFRVSTFLHSRCAMRYVYLGLSQLDVSYSNYKRPQIDGLISSGLDDLSSELIGAGVDMYQSVMFEAVPNIVGTTVREEIQTQIDAALVDVSNTDCPVYQSPPEPRFIEFRDLFGKSKETSDPEMLRYGDTIPMLVTATSEMLDKFESNLSIDPTKVLLSSAPESLTVKASGRCTSSMLSSGLEIEVQDIIVQNLNSAEIPLQSLTVDDSHPHKLYSELVVGSDTDPLRVISHLGISSSYGEAFFQYNELKVTVEMRYLDISSGTMAKVDEESFMTFPLSDALNPFCWLATIPGQHVGGLGFDSDNKHYPFLSISDVVMSTEGVNLDVECVSCDSGGLNELPQILSILSESGTLDDLLSGLPAFIASLSQSRGSQVLLDTILKDAGKKCPHNPMFEPAAENTDTERIDLGEFDCVAMTVGLLRRDSMKYLLFLGVVAMHIGMVVVPLSFDPNVQPRNMDPLSGQILLNVDILSNDGLKDSLLDFTELDILEDMNSRLGKSKADESSASGSSLFVNHLARSLILDTDNLLKIQPNMWFSTEEARLWVDSVTIGGLDSFSAFDVLKAIDSQTIQNSFNLERLEIDISVGLDFPQEGSYFSNEFGFDPVLEQSNGLFSWMFEKKDLTTLRVSLRDVEVSLSMLVALNLDKVGDLKLAWLLDSELLTPCMLSTMHALQITEISASVGDIEKIGLSGHISSDVEASINKSFEAIYGRYKQQILGGIPRMFNKDVMDAINDSVSTAMSQSTEKCKSNVGEGDMNELIDFRDLLLDPRSSNSSPNPNSYEYGDIVPRALRFVREYMLEPDADGSPKLNKRVASLAEIQSNEKGTLKYPGHLVNTSYLHRAVSEDLYFTLEAFDSSVENIDSFGYPLAVLEPRVDDPYALDNKLSVGYGDPLRLSTRLAFTLDYLSSNMMNDLKVHLDIYRLSTMLSLFVKVKKQALMRFPLRDVRNPSCWFAMIPIPELDMYGARVDKESTLGVMAEVSEFVMDSIEVGVECVSCTSPYFEELGDTLSSDMASSQLIGLLMTALNEMKSNETVSLLQYYLDRYIYDSAKSCPHQDVNLLGTGFNFTGVSSSHAEFVSFEEPESGDTALQTVLTVFISGACVAVVLMIMSFVIERQIRKNYREQILHKTDEEVEILYREEMERKHDEELLTKCTESMIRSKCIPKAVRYSVPMIVMLNMGLFISGHISYGGSVEAHLIIGGEKEILPNLDGTSLLEAVMDMWNDGMRSLSIILIVCSVVWPYIKQFLTLVGWCLPPSRLSVPKREALFLLLDFLAKWSMLDILSIVIVISLIRINARVSDDSTLAPDRFIVLDALLKPQWGFYANLLAQVASQISSHFIIMYHRRVAKFGQETVEKIKQSEYDDRGKLSMQTSNTTSETSGSSNGINEGDTLDTNVQYDESKNDSTCDSSGSEGDPLDIIEGIGFLESRDTIVDLNESSYGSESSHSFSNREHSEALCNHVFICSERTTNLRIPRYVNILYGICIFVVFCLIIGGISLPSFRFEFGGLGGVMLNFASSDNKKFGNLRYSVLDVISLLIDQGYFTDTSSGMIFLAFLAGTCAFVVPIILTSALCYAWYGKMTQRSMKRLIVFIECLSAWQYADVCVLSVLLTMSQIGKLVDSLLMSVCGNLDDFFATAAHFEVLSERNARCISVLSKLDVGGYCLILYAVMTIFLSGFVISAIAQQQADILSKEKQTKNSKKPLPLSYMKEDMATELDMVDIDACRKVIQQPLKFTDFFGFLLVSCN